MSGKNAPAMGHDPLAWLADDDDTQEAATPLPDGDSEETGVEQPVADDEPAVEDTVDAATVESDGVDAEAVAEDGESATAEAEPDADEANENETTDTLSDDHPEADEEPGDASGPLLLEGSLCIADVAALYPRLQRLLERDEPIVIDSAGVGNVDAAGAQLLYALVREATMRCIAVTWASVSPTLRATADTLALSEEMGLPPQA